MVSLNWQRLPAQWFGGLVIAGFAGYAAGLLLLAALLHGGGHGGMAVYWALALTGAGMAAAFGPLMTAVLLRVPVADAADATGVIVTVNQLALVIGVATFGTLYLNLAGQLPAGGTQAAFRLLSAHAVTVTSLVLAAAAVGGGVLAAIRAATTRQAGVARRERTAGPRGGWEDGGVAAETEVERAPLDAARLRRELITPGGLWRDVRVLPQTGSTNADLLEQARAGAAEGLVLVAEEQTSGRGRLGRGWSAPPRTALTFSALLRPSAVPPTRLGWLPLLTGVAVASAVREQTGVPAASSGLTTCWWGSGSWPGSWPRHTGTRWSWASG